MAGESEDLMILLRETKEANAEIVSLLDPGERGLAASVLR